MTEFAKMFQLLLDPSVPPGHSVRAYLLSYPIPPNPPASSDPRAQGLKPPFYQISVQGPKVRLTNCAIFASLASVKPPPGVSF
jgi:hypothetical protein